MSEVDPRLFRRSARVTLYRTTTPLFDEEFQVDRASGENGIEITDQRIEFDVVRNLSKHPNTCTIKITNLQKPARVALSKKPLQVVLEAGYDGALKTLFVGDMTYGISKLEGADWVTIIQCGDGQRVCASARISRSYADGITVKSVLKDVAESMGQALPANVMSAGDLNTQLAGYVAFGTSSQQLTTLLSPLGYTWSIQGGKLQILKGDTTTGANDEFLIDATSGIIGSPEYGSPPRPGKAPPINVDMLLYSDLRPGARARLVTSEVNGSFKIESVKHTGDTHGTSWQTQAELKSL